MIKAASLDEQWLSVSRAWSIQHIRGLRIYKTLQLPGKLSIRPGNVQVLECASYSSHRDDNTTSDTTLTLIDDDTSFTCLTVRFRVLITG